MIEISWQDLEDRRIERLTIKAEENLGPVSRFGIVSVVMLNYLKREG